MSGPVDESDARQWLARRRLPAPVSQILSWCIAERSTDEAIGNIDAFDIRRPILPGGCELGYWTHPDSRGEGLMTEALTGLIPHLLGGAESGGLGLRRVTARTSELNLASRSVLRAVGMHQWGVAPRAGIAPDGSAVSQLHFEVLADELDGSVDSLGVEPVTLESDLRQTGEDHRIRLREWRRTDAPRVTEALSDERTRHWLADSLPSPFTFEHAHSYIHGCRQDARDGKALYWCVADPENDRCLGAVAIMRLKDAHGTAGEIGFWAHPDERGRGVMSEAVRLAVRHAFIAREDGGLGRSRLRLNAAEGNAASRHIACANGFVEVGRDRQAEPLGDGTFADLVRFDLLAEELGRALVDGSDHFG
jgi:RimJ/RimL family protein N-acetyltransferase